MGLIIQRYTIDLMGKDQTADPFVDIRDWNCDSPRRFHSPGLRTNGTRSSSNARNNDQGVTTRGKVWKRGEEEPKEWTIEATDATPTRSESPGLWGSSSLVEYYIDNVQVFSNK